MSHQQTWVIHYIYIYIEDNKYYFNNIMEKVIPKSKTKFFQTFCRRFDLKKPSSVVL